MPIGSPATHSSNHFNETHCLLPWETSADAVFLWGMQRCLPAGGDCLGGERLGGSVLDIPTRVLTVEHNAKGSV